jgi:hypothetical protein
MTPEQIKLALCIIIPILMILCFVIWQFYCDERNRRKFYEEKYYKEPRVHHYKQAKSWLTRLFFIMIIFSLISCEKETITIKRCYSCQVTTNGIKKGIDVCVDDPSELTFTNSAGIGLPWVCTEKK